MENDKEHFMPGSNSVAGTSGGYVYLAGVGFQRRGRMEIICRQCEGTGRVRVFTIVAPYTPGKEL